MLRSGLLRLVNRREDDVDCDEKEQLIGFLRCCCVVPLSSDRQLLLFSELMDKIARRYSALPYRTSSNNVMLAP